MGSVTAIAIASALKGQEKDAEGRVRRTRFLFEGTDASYIRKESFELSVTTLLADSAEPDTSRVPTT